MKKSIFITLMFIMSTLTGCGSIEMDFDEPQVSEKVPIESTDIQQNTISSESRIEDNDNKRGIIFDTNGKPLIYTDSDNNKLRYMPEDYAVPFSNIISDFSSGLDTTFFDSLCISNSEAVDIYNSVGQSIQLTINADMQSDIYSVMKNNNAIGSVVVMRTDGSIASMVSYPSYDANKYTSDEKYRNEINNSTNALNNKAIQQNTPGSCFKIISAILAYKHNITTIDDEGSWTVDGAEIHNWDWPYNYPRYDVNVYSAFANSSNVFFAKVFDKIGQETVESEIKEIFLYGDDISIECDFGTLKNTLAINSSDNLRRSGFGQANVRTTPIYLAALVREALYGKMVRPFVLQNYVNTKDYTDILESGSKPYDVITSVPDDYDYVTAMRENMSEVARPLSVSAPEGYNFLAKTGTAEVGNSYYTYISGCIMSSNEKADETIYNNYKDYKGSYIIVFQLQNPAELGFEYASGSAVIYNDIVKKVLERKG